MEATCSIKLASASLSNNLTDLVKGAVTEADIPNVSAKTMNRTEVEMDFHSNWYRQVSARESHAMDDCSLPWSCSVESQTNSSVLSDWYLGQCYSTSFGERWACKSCIWHVLDGICWPIKENG